MGKNDYKRKQDDQIYTFKDQYNSRTPRYPSPKYDRLSDQSGRVTKLLIYTYERGQRGW